MKVLIIGAGGREHAIAQKVSMSSLLDKLYCIPGNAGIAEVAECVDYSVSDYEGIADFAVKEGIDLTIVGPDDPLVGGIVDVFENRKLRVFGPRKNAAIIEGSKSFSKDLMKKYHIPSSTYETFDDSAKAIEYLKTSKFPIVLKADGLALGKGVLICSNYKEAVNGVQEIMEDKQFGSAGDRMVIEEFMTGREVSVLCFCDGTHILPMTSAQDHKRAKDNDLGLNTGGMGTFSPSPFYTQDIDTYCKKMIYQPTMDAMKAEGRDFVGILFVGLMLTKEGPKVLEYNARFGDPETQVILPRMKNDIIEVFEACIEGKLDQVTLDFEENAAVCVVLASNGYPEYYEKGFTIKGLEAFHGKEDYFVFHAGTKKSGRDIVTSGGRVLGITATGRDLIEARQKAYEATTWIEFENKYMRNDIGKAIDEAESHK
ncbi:MAG: phosphoribosylamine--glycine ligase [Mobilitalea sp.]